MSFAHSRVGHRQLYPFNCALPGRRCYVDVKIQRLIAQLQPIVSNDQRSAVGCRCVCKFDGEKILSLPVARSLGAGNISACDWLRLVAGLKEQHHKDCCNNMATVCCLHFLVFFRENDCFFCGDGSFFSSRRIGICFRHRRHLRMKFPSLLSCRLAR